MFRLCSFIVPLACARARARISRINIRTIDEWRKTGGAKLIWCRWNKVHEQTRGRARAPVKIAHIRCTDIICERTWSRWRPTHTRHCHQSPSPLRQCIMTIPGTVLFGSHADKSSIVRYSSAHIEQSPLHNVLRRRTHPGLAQ